MCVEAQPCGAGGGCWLGSLPHGAWGGESYDFLARDASSDPFARHTRGGAVRYPATQTCSGAAVEGSGTLSDRS